MSTSCRQVEHVLEVKKGCDFGNDFNWEITKAIHSCSFHDDSVYILALELKCRI